MIIARIACRQIVITASDCLLFELLTLLFVVITILNVLKGGPEMGGHGRWALPTCGATCFWMVESFMLVVLAIFWYHTRYQLLASRRHPSVPATTSTDIHWDERNTVTYPCLAILAGLVAGMFGIGGGIIKGPLMLALGEYPVSFRSTVSFDKGRPLTYTHVRSTIIFCPTQESILQ